MIRIGLGVACVAMASALVGCTTDVEDPGFTASAGQTTMDAQPSTTDGEAGSTADDSTGSVDPSATSTPTTDGGTTDPTDPATTSSSSTTADPTEGGGCGDGVVSPGEQCDGAELQGLDCTALGLGTGTLGCDPVMCTFDTSMCMSDTGGTSG